MWIVIYFGNKPGYEVEFFYSVSEYRDALAGIKRAGREIRFHGLLMDGELFN